MRYSITMMLVGVTTKKGRPVSPRARFTDTELETIARLLREGADLPSLLLAVGCTQGTFYYRLENSGKLIDEATVRFLRDATPEDRAKRRRKQRQVVPAPAPL